MDPHSRPCIGCIVSRYRCQRQRPHRYRPRLVPPDWTPVSMRRADGPAVLRLLQAGVQRTRTGSDSTGHRVPCGTTWAGHLQLSDHVQHIVPRVPATVQQAQLGTTFGLVSTKRFLHQFITENILINSVVHGCTY